MFRGVGEVKFQHSGISIEEERSKCQTIAMHV